MNPNKGLLCKLNAAVITEKDPVFINCVMFYTDKNPFEVVFMTDQQTEDGGPCEWKYARDLLVQALGGKPETMYGEGDVQVFKENKFLYTIFSQGENKVVLAFMESDMQIFVDETEKVVPIGEEKISESDMDQTLRELLGE